MNASNNDETIAGCSDLFRCDGHPFWIGLLLADIQDECSDWILRLVHKDFCNSFGNSNLLCFFFGLDFKDKTSSLGVTSVGLAKSASAILCSRASMT